MKRFFDSMAARILLAIVVVFAPGLAFSAWYYRIYSRDDYQIYVMMSKECHPVWREFNFRRIGPGADLEEVIRTTKPIEVRRYGDFADMHYQIGFTDIGAVAYKGRLVSALAGSCCWKKPFFDVMTTEQKGLLEQEYKAYMKPTWDRWAREEREDRFIDAAITAVPWCLP